MADERRRRARRGGKTGGNGRAGSKEITVIKAQLAEMVDTVLTGAVSTAPYAVANQILNTKLRAIELERKVREQDELLERIEALEQMQEGAKRWRA